jgi:hypothetical protein
MKVKTNYTHNHKKSAYIKIRNIYSHIIPNVLF